MQSMHASMQIQLTAAALVIVGYVQAKGEVRAVGTATPSGIQTEGHAQPLGLSAFEALSGSTMRRPTANIWTTKGETVLDLINAAAGREGVQKCATTGLNV